MNWECAIPGKKGVSLLNNYTKIFYKSLHILKANFMHLSHLLLILHFLDSLGEWSLQITNDFQR